MKLKLFLCAILVLGALSNHVHAASYDHGTYYCPGYTTSPVYTTYNQKTTNNNYNHVKFDVMYGYYTRARCSVMCFDGTKYVSSSECIECVKSIKYRIDNNNSNIKWVSGTYLKLALWSGMPKDVDYNYLEWWYY